jgi:hypothetical protein
MRSRLAGRKGRPHYLLLSAQNLYVGSANFMLD